jgi:protein-glutamine gamma-glutamyltransferase
MAATAPDSHNLLARVASYCAPLTRLLGPQISSAARERRDMLVLLLAVTFIVLPHLEHLAAWAAAVLALLLVWRAFLTLTQSPLPGRVLMLPLLVAAGAAVYMQHGTLAGQQAGVTFLLLLMALKLLEMRARRDIFVVIFLSFFILLTQYLYGQGLPVAVMSLAAVVALFFVLVSVNLDEADLPAMRKLRLVGGVVLKALPLTAVLFLLFPRLSGPLWGMPGDSTAGATGLSNSMAPGSISRLLESPEVAFRVKFEGRVPRNAELYWRGPVFGSFNGRAWVPLAIRRVDPAPVEIVVDRASAVAYSVTLEPSSRDWLFGLELPAEAPALGDLPTRLTPEMQMIAGDLIRNRIRYSLRSYTSFRFGANADPRELQDWLDLPDNFNPRTRAFADEIRSATLAPAAAAGTGHPELINAVLAHLRRGSYEYSLAPPRLGRHSVDEFLFDTRRGYCEHYASAFVFLMRTLGIPARVVTGYQGGEFNPVDGFVTVRQSDAHAWAEVWLAGRGWVRIDPTAVVAPMRIDEGAAEIARQSGIALTTIGGGAAWLRSIRFNWEAVQNAWHQWVLSYSQDRQRGLVELLGLAPSLESVAAVLAILMTALLGVMAVVSLRPRTEPDPLGDAFRLLRDRLDSAGVVTGEHLGPRELYRRSKRVLQREDLQRARKLLSRYEKMRYSRHSEGIAASDVRAYKRAIRAFHPRPAAQ